MNELFRTATVFVALAALTGCTSAEIEELAGGPETISLDLVPLLDLNPDADVVEVELVAGAGRAEYLPGKRADVLAFRDGAVPETTGKVPGPILEAKVGDRVIVHFRNELAHEMTVHWHGLRLPNAADGTPAAQVAVAEGGTFDYEFTALDAGTFWYHPHMMADELIERGLYGAVRVQGDGPVPADADRVFVLDDVKLESTGQLSTATEALDVMLGRRGNVLLVNGRSDAKLPVRAGTRERWRFVNTANGRFFNLRFEDDRPLFVIAWDADLLERPYYTDRLLIAPGERYEVLVGFGDADVGSALVLQTVHYDRGHSIPDSGPLDLMRVNVLERSAVQPAPELPFISGEWSPLPVLPDTPVRKFKLTEEENGADVKFMINDESFPEHTPISGVEGAVEIWEVHNESEMDHPFHLHGMFFQVLDVNGVSPVHHGLKDTVNVPKEAVLRFAVRYGPPGNWMYHCHILEHAERGMMGELRLTSFSK